VTFLIICQVRQNSPLSRSFYLSSVLM